MDYRLIEMCCGSAAFTLHKLGAKRAILPYQGSKWKLRHALEEVAAGMGFAGAPRWVSLVDAGPWGETMGWVLDPEGRAMVIADLAILNDGDPLRRYLPDDADSQSRPRKWLP